MNVESFGLGGAVTKQLGTLLTAGVAALLPTTKELYVTRVADAIMDMKPDMGVDNYLYFDPKIQKKRQSAIPRKNTPFREGIVFVIGGGNYIEYQNLQEYAKVLPFFLSYPILSYRYINWEHIYGSIRYLILHSGYYLYLYSETTYEEDNIRFNRDCHCQTVP